MLYLESGKGLEVHAMQAMCGMEIKWIEARCSGMSLRAGLRVF